MFLKSSLIRLFAGFSRLDRFSLSLRLAIHTIFYYVPARWIARHSTSAQPHPIDHLFFQQRATLLTIFSFTIRTEPSRESKVSFSAALCPQAEQGDRYIRAEFKNSKSAHLVDVIMYKRRTGELWKFFFEHKKWEKKIILKLCWFKCYQFYYGVSTG